MQWLCNGISGLHRVTFDVFCRFSGQLTAYHQLGKRECSFAVPNIIRCISKLKNDVHLQRTLLVVEEAVHIKEHLPESYGIQMEAEALNPLSTTRKWTVHFFNRNTNQQVQPIGIKCEQMLEKANEKFDRNFRRRTQDEKTA